MKRFFSTIVVLLLIAILAATLTATLAACGGKDGDSDPIVLQLTVMSYNIRTSSAGTSEQDLWDNRKAAMVAHIIANDPDIIGMQEVFAPIQDAYLEEHLSDYAAVGVSRDFGELMPLGEKNSIFYKKDKFELLDSGTFWLSDTPDTISQGWDGACNRICTYVLLKDNATGKTFMHFNTHFDHRGEEARTKGSSLVAERVKNCGYPALLTGDFNFDETDDLYTSITQVLDDAKYLAADTTSYGTFHAYSSADLSSKSPIDFCMLTPNTFSVQSYQVLFGKYNDVFTSDHFAIKIKLSF